MRSGDTAWVLVSAALVLFMTPGLALFYGGMVRAKNVLAVMMQNFVAIGVVTVLWAVVAFSLAFGHDAGGGLIGGLGLAGLAHTARSLPGFHGLTVSPLAVMAFQMMFAIITAALISGGIVDRTRFWGFVVLICAWTLLVYAPLAHWVFSPGGWLAHHGVLDFAGGTVVEINSGFSTLAVVLVVGRRRGWPKEQMQPHSVPLSLLGAGILWFGWFGFNAGSALGANAVAVHAFVNTQLAAGAGLLGWIGFEQVKERYPTTLGAASGAVAAMVAITPCAGYVAPMAALLIGLLGGVVCAAAVRVKFRLGYDDSLDVLGVHGVGGLLGMVLLGLFASKSIDPAGANGLFEGAGGAHFFGWELIAAVVAAAYAFAMTWIIAKVVDRTVGLRVPPEVETQGLDLALHAETAYSIGAGGRLSS
ncbi:MAG: ammonium transporter [Actinomycetota bacterium]|jgi:Amt family ammonium transporter|nr:ammonium transporter [Actinomycetota bacterium]